MEREMTSQLPFVWTQTAPVGIPEMAPSSGSQLIWMFGLETHGSWSSFRNVHSCRPPSRYAR